ncbi:uncharacterized protein TRAVEDRAFT_52299 [Trametes versicolor FP-101664 SS1]|uniref:uncharacterized protein n=1 Tax=Trametes versicolor (strain FP-101664) TaxID=717944 RepID=UPI00046230BB|nr:uncharacterized protein TRAVEDRAFT_52299 [Trametes versicolor FP-101664 SS1]EIW53162.1 hypothetical protein TRAVEDRAFT_52299 [Trametes versicolor FP-101664 SS1]
MYFNREVSSLSSEAEPTSTAAPSSSNSIVSTSVISSTDIIIPTTTSGDGATGSMIVPPALPHLTSDANIIHTPSSSSSLGVSSSIVVSPTSVDGTNSTGSSVNTTQSPTSTTSGNTVSGLSSHSAPLNGTIAPSEPPTSYTVGFSTSSSLSALTNTVVTPSSSIGTNVGSGATSGSLRHTPHAVVIALPVASAMFFVTAALCLYKSKKRRSRETSDMTPAACVPEPRSTEQHWTDVADVSLVDDYEPHLITPGLSIYIPPAPSMISSPSAHRDVSAQGYRSPALDSISSPSVTDDFPHCLSDGKVTGDTPASPASLSVCTPRDQMPQQDRLHRRGSDAPIPPESTSLAYAYERHIASSAPNHLPTSAPDSSLRSSTLPIPQPDTPTYDTRVIIESRRSAQDADGTGGQERIVRLPWPLGERLLAILEITPQQYGPGELDSTRVGSEELPAYAPRE